MKPEMKKLIIANLPYLLFVYLFGKLGQAYRLAEGIDLSQKLLHFADGCAAAFESAAPSFNPFDLLIGVAGAAALRLMVYCKGKNAKKYRKGVEYGSARWGGPKDIAPYIDPNFDNNMVWTSHTRSNHRFHDCDCLLYSNCFSRDFSIYRIESFNVADRDDCRNISAITNLLFHQYMDNVAANYGGDTWQTLLGVALRIQSFAFIPVWGISQGFQPAAGTNYGAKQYDRVKTLAKVFMIGATLVSLLFYIPIELAPKAVISLFITDPAIVDQGVANFRIFFSSYILQGSMIVIITLLQALGRAKKASIMSLLRQIVLFIPCVMILPMIADMGIRGVWAAPAVVDVIIFIICAEIAVIEFRRMSLLKKEVC